jgi:hypothetical protein
MRLRVGAEGINLDEPLLHRAKNDGRFGAPAVGVIVAIFLLGEEVAFVLEDLDDERVGLEDILAGEFRNAGFGGEAAAIVDRREDFETMLLAELVIVMAMAGCDVDESRACVGGDEVGGEDLACPSVVEERMLISKTNKFGAFEALDRIAAGYFINIFIKSFVFNCHLAFNRFAREVRVIHEQELLIAVLVDRVIELLRHCHREIRRQGPRRCRPY